MSRPVSVDHAALTHMTLQSSQAEWRVPILFFGFGLLGNLGYQVSDSPHGRPDSSIFCASSAILAGPAVGGEGFDHRRVGRMGANVQYPTVAGVQGVHHLPATATTPGQSARGMMHRNVCLRRSPIPSSRLESTTHINAASSAQCIAG